MKSNQLKAHFEKQGMLFQRQLTKVTRQMLAACVQIKLKHV
jgi:hypothetical protein